MCKSKIIITVDTEVGERLKNFKKGFEKLILGEIDGEYYGVPIIIEIAEKYGYKCEFFIDVYEYKKFGEDKFEELCQYIHKKIMGCSFILIHLICTTKIELTCTNMT